MLITNRTLQTHNKHIYVFIHLIVKDRLRKAMLFDSTQQMPNRMFTNVPQSMGHLNLNNGGSGWI